MECDCIGNGSMCRSEGEEGRFKNIFLVNGICDVLPGHGVAYIRWYSFMIDHLFQLKKRNQLSS